MPYGSAPSSGNAPEFDPHEIIRAWKARNPDWQDISRTRPARDSAIMKMRRQQVRQQLAELSTTGLQRMVVAKYQLRPDPRRGHFGEWLHSELMTQAQQRRGIYLPLHEEIEEHLASLIEAVDEHTGNVATDFGVWIEDWFDEHVRQPTMQALGQRRR